MCLKYEKRQLWERGRENGSFTGVEVLKPQGFKEKRSFDALVAQWIERLVAVQKVAGSIPAKRTKIRSFHFIWELFIFA